MLHYKKKISEKKHFTLFLFSFFFCSFIIANFLSLFGREREWEKNKQTVDYLCASVYAFVSFFLLLLLLLLLLFTIFFLSFIQLQLYFLFSFFSLFYSSSLIRYKNTKNQIIFDLFKNDLMLSFDYSISMFHFRNEISVLSANENAFLLDKFVRLSFFQIILLDFFP